MTDYRAWENRRRNAEAAGHAKRIVEVLAAGDEEITPDVVHSFTPAHWEALAEQAGLRGIDVERVKAHVMLWVLTRFPGMPNPQLGAQCSAAGGTVDGARLDGNGIGECPLCRRLYVAHRRLQDGRWVIGSHVRRDALHVVKEADASGGGGLVFLDDDADADTAAAALAGVDPEGDRTANEVEWASTQGTLA